MVVQPKTRKLQGDCFVAFQYKMGVHRENGDRLIFTEVCSDRTRDNIKS